MPTLTMYGASDDLVESAGLPGCDEFNVYSRDSDDNPVRASFVLGGLLRIYALYDGCWSFAVGLVDDELPWPEDWTVHIGKCKDCAYSALLSIDVPTLVALVRERDRND